MFSLNILSKTDIAKILQKLDYISFVRIQQTCKDVASLVSDSPQLYSVRVVDNIVIDYCEDDGKYSWVIGKHIEWSHRGIPMDCINSAMILNLLESETGTMTTENLAAALRGLCWRRFQLMHRANSSVFLRTRNRGSNHAEKIEGVLEALQGIITVGVPKCEEMVFQYSNQKALEISTRICNPEGVKLQSAFSFPDINITLQGIKEVEMDYSNHTLDGLFDFCVDRQRVDIGGTLTAADWNELNRVLKAWQKGQSSIEFLKLNVEVPLAPETIVDSLETIPFINGKKKHFAHAKHSRNGYGGELGTESSIEMTSWLIRCRKMEDGLPVYGLLIYEKDNDRQRSTVVTFRKLIRSPDCYCDNPACSESIAVLFPCFVDGCYPITLGTLYEELLETSGVSDLGAALVRYIDRQLVFLSMKRLEDCA